MSDYNFDAIRPYGAGEMKKALNDLLSDRQFSRMLRGFIPLVPVSLVRGLLRLAFWGIETPLQFQIRFMKPIVNHILKKHSKGATMQTDGVSPGPERYLFLSNHRDIVLDSAILSVLLHDNGFPTTCEIAIGDNLLIYPWINTLVKMNKAFTVRRGLSPRELMESSLKMSAYIHYAITRKHENVWMAQREGRAKDSSDQTQDSVLKMLALGGKGTDVQRLMELNIVPLSISYEYDPCDYLKAKEFQLKRDNPSYKKSKQDDLDNMKTGIFGQKGRIHYQASCCINAWLPELEGMPRKEFFTEVAKRIDKQIHAGYQLFPGNYVAYDMLNHTSRMACNYSEKDKEVFEKYLASRIALVDIPNRDEEFLRERLLTMYANPVINKIMNS